VSEESRDESREQGAGSRETGSQEHHSDSTICGVSVRAWLVLILVGTVCVMALGGQIMGYLVTGEIVLDVKEPLYSLAIAAASYYFGQTQKKPTT
jgi:hypothetical protein